MCDDVDNVDGGVVLDYDGLTVHYCTGLHWPVLDRNGLYGAVLGCTGLYWAVMGCTVDPNPSLN